MSECIVATFDFGGTNMRAATVSVEGFGWRILDRQHRPTSNYLLDAKTPAGERLEGLLEFLTSYAQSSQLRFGAEALVAAIPGPVQGAGIVLALSTILGPDSQAFCPFDLLALITSRMSGMQVRVMNDVSAAGYRFVRNGGDFAIFTIGSGIGLKVFLDGQPRVGSHGLGGELTHMVFDTSPDAPLCDCGGRGHLGALASGRAWLRVEAGVHEANRELDLARFTEPLARAVAMLHFSLGLERFIFAGGLTEKLGEVLRTSIVKNLPSQGWNVGQDWNAMVQLAPADDAHALIGGALALALNKSSGR